MHSHGHDHEHETQDSLRPRGSRLRRAGGCRVVPGSGEGRPDVLGPTGLLRLQRLATLVPVGWSTVAASSTCLVQGGSPSTSRFGRTWRPGSGTTSATCGYTPATTADRSARSVSAHAYTVGSNIVFQRGRLRPRVSAGRTLLAHELTHVVQQRSGPVDGDPAGGASRSATRSTASSARPPRTPNG